ncbi:glycine--tRNA ligase subunit beta [Rhodobacteraceae bacterium 2CG4]|uniref:Glycine--tRNA ligase beta subunit n=1 Tax=Halovulum marinum TaxID=2662447 RepID=A0A6L5Z1B4_9RHOB|nr:glycine--tRNA ligase subunit beta [Halovulum marinum]MSU90099.1 glycine--tRNA ligase subunit beta [Halovulum marinum]
MPDLLLELLSEEIPARMQARAAEDLRRLVTEALVAAGLTYAGAGAFATPRRLTLAVEGLTGRSPDTREERKGPRADAPEKAIEGFLRSTGLTREQLEVRDDKKGQVLFAVMERPGRAASDIIAEVVPQVVRSFPWPKSMRWGSGSLRWVRPLHSILCILSDEAGAQVVPFDVDGIAAGDSTVGHRFMAPERFAVISFEDYELKLARAHVMLNPETRADKIRHDAEQMAFAQGLEVVEDKGLLAEVAGLVEWPVVLIGDIGEDFLDLPPEVLRTSMKEHQKFFSVRNPNTGRIEKFVTVANRETADQGATILHGNDKVLAARLSDAKFFWENDLRTIRDKGMEGMAAPLANVTFHARLGTQAERIARIEALAREIARQVGADESEAGKAAQVVKADLASEMVYEFPELQGIMGGYYAREAKLSDAVAKACAAHYQPLGPSDDVPTEPVSVAVALADKIDMLTCFWAIYEKPTGSGDPYALRRAALGVIRILLANRTRMRLKAILSSIYREGSLNNFYGFGLNLERFGDLSRGYEGQKGMDLVENLPPYVTFAYHELVYSSEVEDGLRTLKINPKYSKGENIEVPDEYYSSVEQFDRLSALEPVSAGEAAGMSDDGLALLSSLEERFSADLISFFADRLKVHLRGEGIRHDVIDACFQLGGQDDLVLLVNRVRALQAFLDTDNGANLLAGYKRAANILAQEEKKDGVEYSLDPQPQLAETGEERALFDALDIAEARIAPALQAEDFAAAMAAMAGLRAPIDAFFDNVMVNADSDMVRRNRLCLLNRIRAVMNRVAILSVIEG